MIISRTPFRVSLFGGGSDYPKWYREHGGAVLGFAINKYCYISIRPLPPFFEHRHRIVYSVVENVSEIDEIKHPAVRAVLQDQKIEIGLEIHHDGDPRNALRPRKPIPLNHREDGQKPQWVRY